MISLNYLISYICQDHNPKENKNDERIDKS